MIVLRRLAAGVFGLILAAAPALAQEKEAPPLDKLLPNDTEMVLVVKVKDILDSPFVKSTGLTGMAKDFLGSAEEVQSVLKELNFDPLKDVEQVTVAICSGSDTDKGLVIVRGKFDVDKFKAKAEEAAKDNKDLLTIHKAPGGHTVYEVAPPGASQAVFVAIANNSTLLAAPSKDYLLDALDKEAGKKKTQLKNKDVQELLGRLDPKLMVALAVPGKTIAQSPLLEGDAKTMLDKVQDVVAGVVFEKDVKAHLAITANKPTDATSLHQTVSKGVNSATAALALIANDQPLLEPVLDLVKSIKPRLKEKTITIEATVPAELIEKLLKSAK